MFSVSGPLQNGEMTVGFPFFYSLVSFDYGQTDENNFMVNVGKLSINSFFLTGGLEANSNAYNYT